MTQAVAIGGFVLRSIAAKTLKASAVFWFVIAVAGQWLFALYVAVFYGGAVARGDMGAWNDVLPHGIVAGDAMGNAAMAGHLLLAFIITIGGPLQLIPQIRARAPTFHHWNGRIYMATAFAVSVAGLYLIWSRGATGGLVNAIAISINAALIMICAAMALRHAMARNIDTHRRWALRLFLVVNGVWFFRVGMMLWIFLNGGPVGVGENLDGPFAISWAFGQYILPLAVLELYLRARDRAGALSKFAMAGGLVVLTVGMGVGIAMASMFMWLPRL